MSPTWRTAPLAGSRSATFPCVRSRERPAAVRVATISPSSAVERLHRDGDFGEAACRRCRRRSDFDRVGSSRDLGRRSVEAIAAARDRRRARGSPRTARPSSPRASGARVKGHPPRAGWPGSTSTATPSGLTTSTASISTARPSVGIDVHHRLADAHAEFRPEALGKRRLDPIADQPDLGRPGEDDRGRRGDDHHRQHADGGHSEENQPDGAALPPSVRPALSDDGRARVKSGLRHSARTRLRRA